MDLHLRARNDSVDVAVHRGHRGSAVFPVQNLPQHQLLAHQSRSWFPATNSSGRSLVAVCGMGHCGDHSEHYCGADHRLDDECRDGKRVQCGDAGGRVAVELDDRGDPSGLRVGIRVDLGVVLHLCNV